MREPIARRLFYFNFIFKDIARRPDPVVFSELNLLLHRTLVCRSYLSLCGPPQLIGATTPQSYNFSN